MPDGAAAQRAPASGAEASQPPAVGRRMSSADLLSTGTLLPTFSGPQQQQQQQQQLQAAETPTTPARGGSVASLPRRQQLQETGNPSAPPPLPPRPPAPLLQVSAGNAPSPPASPLWPWLTPARDTANAPSATAAAATATGVDLLSRWNRPTASPRSSPRALGVAAASSVEDVAATTTVEEASPASLRAPAATESTIGSIRASVATPQPRRPLPPYPTAAVHAVEAAAADFAATSPEPPEPDRRAAVEDAAAGFAAATRDDGRDSARRRSHGRLDAASAALAAVRSPTGERGAPAEDALTAEEAQAILDAADMAAAEAVVAAAEAAEAGSIAALAFRQPPTGADAARPQPSRALSRPDSIVRRALREIAAADLTSAARAAEAVVEAAEAAEAGSVVPLAFPQPPTGAALAPVADDMTPAARAAAAASLSGANGSTAAAGAAGATAAGRTEEEEVVAAVAAVAELEARDRLQSSTGWASGRGGPVVQGAPGDKDAAVVGISRCACRSNVEWVVPPAGTPQKNDTSNCRNCWRAVCDDCVGTFWARSMVPPRYTLDSDEYRMRVCKTCDAAMEAFRKALLLGQAEEAMSAYSTGCVNLDRPYTIYHGELPVHCAAAGGNVGLLSWLVDELGCRLYVDFHKKEPVRDLRRLTVLGAAAVNGQVQAMRYLVHQKGSCVSEITHIPTLKSALDACLHGSANTRDGERSCYKVDSSPGSPVNAAGVSISSSAAANMAASAAAADEEDDCCIVCFDSAVDCTLVPCGHHCCCVRCAAKFSLCPVCRTPVTQKIKTISV